MNTFLPINDKDLKDRRWDSCDFILVTGDAYVDHPSFGAAVISRVLEAEGYRVGIIAQPDWKNPESVKVLGKPKYGFLVTAGNMDSMVSAYSSSKKPRRKDAYSPGGETGKRPDRALIVYTSLVRQAYKGVAVILGGIEGSLRRFTHYDYWSNKLRRPILLDAKADLLIYGMGESAIIETAGLLASGVAVREIRSVRGTCYRCSSEEAAELSKIEGVAGALGLPSFGDCQDDGKDFARAFKIMHDNTNPHNARALCQAAEGLAVVCNPPAYPLDGTALDRIYQLPYVKKAHPVYDGYAVSKDGNKTLPVPALEEVRFSLASSRGCFGSCSFCALTFHQGRTVTGRTPDSLVKEATEMISHPDFKGYIHDVGGPTANFFHPACKKQEKSGACADRECLFPGPCKNLDTDHSDYIRLLRRLRKLPGIKKVFIRSGIRYDYMMGESSDEFLKELTAHHVSGQLKVAPEHASPRVLKLMGKPPIGVFTSFRKRFMAENERLGKKQYIIPYLISGHPGSTLKEAIVLAEFLKKERFIPDQVQDFYPTPGTRSTCMYYTGLDPLTMEEVYVPRTPEEKAMQRALIHFHKPENFNMARKALIKAGREDLIGGNNGLVPYERKGAGNRPASKNGNRPGFKSGVKPGNRPHNRPKK
ncbi:MAG: YgiQ family radical SAM protein [Spirochaetales bacterium]|nr:YgiQ family radical SAM protein [Spirochaetales bacterium]